MQVSARPRSRQRALPDAARELERQIEVSRDTERRPRWQEVVECDCSLFRSFSSGGVSGGGTVTETIPVAMPPESPPTWFDGSQSFRHAREESYVTTVPSGRFAALSNTSDSDSEHALVVRASSNADAGGRVAVLAGSPARRKRLRVVEFQHLRRV